MKNWRRSQRPSSQQPLLPGLFAPQARSHRLSSPHDVALERAQHRLIIFMLTFSLAFLVIIGRVGYLSLLNESPEQTGSGRSDVNTASESITTRADITDRNGVVLATSLPTVSVCTDGKKLLNPDEAEAQLIIALPDLDRKKLHDDLHNPKHCVTIKRHLTPKQQYDVNKLGIAGLEFQSDERRVYPSGYAVAHVLGYTDIDNNGIAGIERSMNNRLMTSSEPLVLSIDLRVQNVLRHILTDTVNEYHAIGAAGLVMDVATGETLALVSLPDFDPQRPGVASDMEKFNRATLGVYEMGSTFKVFNSAMALDSGAIRVSDTFDTTQPLVVGSHKIRDFHPEDRWMNVAEIFTHSSNIGSALMAEKLGGARQRAFLGNLGLTSKLAYELPEIGAPLLPSAKNWSAATTMTASFGHGIAVNAVQLVGATASILNNGIQVKPTLLKKNSSPDSGQSALPPEQVRVVSAHTSALIRGLFRLVVTRGTAKGAATQGYLVGGKTGTADKIGGNHDYKGHGRVASFIGAFPIHDPRYVIFALVDDPKGNAKTAGFATGGIVSAPIAHKLITQIGPILGMKPMEAGIEDIADKQVLKVLGSVTVDGVPVDKDVNKEVDYAPDESNSID